MLDIFAHLLFYNSISSLPNSYSSHVQASDSKLLFHCDPSNIEFQNSEVQHTSSFEIIEQNILEWTLCFEACTAFRWENERARETISLHLKKAGSVRLTFCFEFIGECKATLWTVTQVRQSRLKVSIFKTGKDGFLTETINFWSQNQVTEKYKPSNSNNYSERLYSS